MTVDPVVATAPSAAPAQAEPGAPASELSELQRAAMRHLWPQFSPLGHPGRVFVRGEGCHVWDESGRRFLDGLSMLFCVNAGHGRRELADAAARQAARLAYATTWGPAHPAAIELAERIAALAPGALNRTFFTSGGGESVDTAIKLARAYHRLGGEPTRYKVIARELAYHGTTTGALTATGLTYVRTDFEPLAPGGCHVPSTYSYRAPAGWDPMSAADAIEERILHEGPATVAAVILEPVQNSGGCLTPPEGYFDRVREICDRYGVLLISDEVICAWGRLGAWFGAERYGYLPDIITAAKGITSAYAPMGAVIASDRVADRFLAADASFDHGVTFGGHPVAAAVALANLELIEREDLLGNVRRHEGLLEALLSGLDDLPLVGDVRGAGYFWAIELVKDQATRATFTDREAEDLMGRVDAALQERGLIARALTRGYPVVQLAPPLIATAAELEAMVDLVRQSIAEVGRRWSAW